MADLPITQVGRIDGLVFGRPSIVNNAKGFTASSVGLTSRIGKAAIFLVDKLAHNATLNFDVDRKEYPNRFTFGGALLQPKVGLQETLVFGRIDVSVGAQALRPAMPELTRYGFPFVRPSVQIVDFPFDHTDAINTEPYFHFGEPRVITQVGNIAPPQFRGVERTTIAFTAAPQGIYQYRAGLPTIFAGISGHLDFEFDHSNDLDYTPGARNFVFGGPQLVTQVTLDNSERFGNSVSIRNGADSTGAAGGIESRMRFGYPILSPRKFWPEIPTPLDLGFNQDLRSSNALNVPFYFYFDYEVPVQGTYMTGYGTPKIRNDKDILLPQGILATRFGATKITVGANHAQTISINGFVATQYGWNYIDLYIQYAETIGSTYSLYGKPHVDYGTAYTYPAGIDSQLFGDQMVSHFLREIGTGMGIDQSDSGTPWISYGQRQLITFSINPVTVPIPQVGPKIIVKPEGIYATKFGERIIPESQKLYPQGFGELYGLPYVGNYTRYIRVNGLDQSTVNGPDKIYNLTQYVVQYYIGGSELNPPEWSKWIYVENVNKNPVTHGTFFQAFGRPQIDLKAAPIKLKGLDATTFGKHLIADKIRYLHPEAIEDQPISRWTAIHNAARVLAAKGFGPNDVFGKPGILNTRRYFPYIGAIDSLEFGEPMVAFRVRDLWIESRYSINPPQIPLPKLELMTRYIQVKGDEYYGTGNAHLEIKWNKITTRWNHRDLFGNPSLHNVTPELHSFGSNSEEFGLGAIRNEWENLTVSGLDMMLFGRALIEYRTKNIKPVNWVSNIFGNDTTVIKTASPPYTPQYIYLGPGSDEDINKLPHQGIGYDREEDRFGDLNVRGNMLWVKGFEATEYGKTNIHSNGILVEPGIFGHYFGEPFVSTTGRIISPQGIGSTLTISEHAAVSPQRISPYSFGQHVIGNHTVNLYHRKLNVGSFFTSVFGQTNVELRKRYIYPTGFTTQRFGWLMFPFDETLEVESVEDTLSFGTARIHRPPYLGPQTIYPYGLDAFSAEQNHIELLHREVKAIGFETMTMGSSRGPLNPYMWQSLRIGERIPTAIGGYYATLFGTAWISNWIREVKPAGFDTFTSEYDYTHFDRRMRVTREEFYDISDQTSVVDGFDNAALGVANVRLAVHYIRPDGNSDQFRKGAINPIKNAAEGFYIKPSGVMVARIGIAQVRYAETGPLNLNLEWEQRHFDGDFNF